MMAFLRTLPNTLWWITLFLAVVAFFTQIGIAVARSGAVSVGLLLAEFVFTLVFLAIPLGIGWYGRPRGSLWPGHDVHRPGAGDCHDLRARVRHVTHELRFQLPRPE